MKTLTIHHLPLTDNQIDELTKQYNISREEMVIALNHLEDSIDGTDDVNIKYMLYHMSSYLNKVRKI